MKHKPFSPPHLHERWLFRTLSSISFQFSVEESGHYIYCGTDSGDIVKLVVTADRDRSRVVLQVQTCAVMKRGRVIGSGGGKRDVNAGKFAGGALEKQKMPSKLNEHLGSVD